MADTANENERRMRQALGLARATVGLASPNPQVGCVLVRDGEVVGEGAHLYDGYDHAEILALKQAEELGVDVHGATAYVTLEPCPMCAGALIAARVGRLVFGAPDPKAGACGSLYNLCADPRLNHELPVDHGVREAECAELLQGWFVARRG